MNKRYSILSAAFQGGVCGGRDEEGTMNRSDPFAMSTVLTKNAPLTRSKLVKNKSIFAWELPGKPTQSRRFTSQPRERSCNAQRLRFS